MDPVLRKLTQLMKMKESWREFHLMNFYFCFEFERISPFFIKTYLSLQRTHPSCVGHRLYVMLQCDSSAIGYCKKMSKVECRFVAAG